MISHLSRNAEGGMLRVQSRVLGSIKQTGKTQELWSTNKGDLWKIANELGISTTHWPISDKLSPLDLLAYFQQRKLKDGLVLYHGFKSFLVANPKKNPAILCLYNSLFPPYGRRNLRYLALTYAKNRVRSLQNVVVASKSQAQEAKEIFSNVIVIPSGVDTRKFVPTTSREQKIGFLGRLRRQKGVDLLLHAANCFPEWEFEFAGPDLDGYGNRTLPKNVKLLGEVRSPEEVISRWSVMVLPSYTEAMPLSILEGMSSGLAIIATDTGDIKEMLADGKEGIIIPVGDLQKLTEALEKVTVNKDLRVELGSRAREKVEQYDWRNIEKMWVDIIDKWG